MKTNTIRNPRPIRFRHIPADGNGDYHNLQIALALLAEDENPRAVNRMIRDACHDAATVEDLFRAQRIGSITTGKRAGSVLGPRLACEVLAAIGWLLEEHANDGKETP